MSSQQSGDRYKTEVETSRQQQELQLQSHRQEVNNVTSQHRQEVNSMTSQHKQEVVALTTKHQKEVEKLQQVNYVNMSIFHLFWNTFLLKINHVRIKFSFKFEVVSEKCKNLRILREERSLIIWEMIPQQCVEPMVSLLLVSAYS